MCNAKYYIMATHPLPPGEWLPLTQSLFIDNGYKTIKLNNGLFVSENIKQYNHVSYADGAIVNRIWLGPKQWGLSAVNKRFYLDKNSFTIDKRHEYEIIGKNKPPHEHSSVKIKSQWKVLNIIIQSYEKYGFKLVRVENLNIGPQQVSIKGNDLLVDSFNSLYNNYGFDYVPEEMKIYICPLDNVSNTTANYFAGAIDRCMKKRKSTCSINVVNIEVVINSLVNLKKEKRQVSRGSCLFFILPNKNTVIKQKYLKLFNELEQFDVPFRRAYVDDPLKNSIPDQLPSLLMAAGGRPHKTSIKAKNKQIWTIGIDMGHSVNFKYSKVALSLIDPNGLPVKFWISKQSLDETFCSKLLLKMLTSLKAELYSYDVNADVVIMRDGRFMEKEQPNICRKTLGNKISIFEYRKRGNPQIFHFNDNGIPIISECPTAVVLSNTQTMFLATMDRLSPYALPYIAKVVWKPEWNGLELNKNEIANIFLDSVNTPSLGLRQRHLPACIYWADGIAKTNDEDLKFRGQRICRLDSLD